MKIGMLTNVLDKVKNIPKKSLDAGKEIKDVFGIRKMYSDATCIFFYNNRVRILPANIDKNFKYIEPKGLNLRVENKHSYTLEPDNTPVFIVHVDNVNTLKVDDEPKVQTIEKVITKYSEKDGEILKTVDMQKFKQIGARFLNEKAYDVMRTTLLRFMTEPSKKETLFIILISVLFGMVLMAFLMTMIVI